MWTRRTGDGLVGDGDRSRVRLLPRPRTASGSFATSQIGVSVKCYKPQYPILHQAERRHQLTSLLIWCFMGRVIYPDGVSCETDQVSGSIPYQFILDAIRNDDYKPDYRARCIVFISKLNVDFAKPIMPYLNELATMSDLTLRTAARGAIRDISRQENAKVKHVVIISDKMQFVE